ncbi:MAG TPA: TIM barrel protein [Phycisphaerae bacterium]|nr:TIM barrel protein [Phycisphaerae bacterium]HPS52268.1 TIM barrel protein [Phycisphaerae bacterium]
MIKTGLVSITFRQLGVQEIVSLVQKAGLDGIEWGGDVHVPHGDVSTAEHVRDLTTKAGLETAAYGSYYRLGATDTPKFSDVLASAVALGTDKIRVWAGKKASDIADYEYRKQIVEDAKRVADLAAEKGITIVCEWHCNTLTDELDSGKKLLNDVAKDNFKTYWQPSMNRLPEVCMKEIDELIPHLAGMHVYAWESTTRLPLSNHYDLWRQYFNRAKSAGDFFALMEFVEGDSQDSFLRDAAVLKSLQKETI